MAKREKSRSDDEWEKLFSSPEWLAQEAALDAEDLAAEEEERIETRELLEDLAAAGMPVHSVWDLVNTDERYPEAIPVLVAHLGRPYDEATKEAIARALTVREARGIATQALIDEFVKLPAPEHTLGAKWAIGNALALVATKEYADQIVKLACDQRHGPARSELPRALGKFRTPDVKAALEALVSDPDPDVRTEASRALKKF